VNMILKWIELGAPFDANSNSPVSKRLPEEDDYK